MNTNPRRTQRILNAGLGRLWSSMLGLASSARLRRPSSPDDQGLPIRLPTFESLESRNLFSTAVSQVQAPLHVDLTASLAPASLLVPTLTVASSASPVALGRTITFFATVTGTSSQPTGSVTFTDGTTTLGASTLSGGIATVRSALGAGTHAIQAVYSGDSVYSGASAGMSQVVIDNTTSTTLVSPSTASKGQSVTFLATVTSHNGAPTGGVAFFNGSASLGFSPLSGSGVATFTSSSLSVGAYNVVASYAGTLSSSGVAPFAGSASAPQLLLIGTANQRYVNQLYVDLFHRVADDVGLGAWTNAIDGGESYLQVAKAITSSREYDGVVVDGFYTSYLGRHADALGLNAWVNQMQNGLNAEVIRAGILGSQEYYNESGGDDIAYVTKLYQTFLNRAPDSDGLAAWTNLLVDPAQRQAVATGISNSDENRTDIITQFYMTYLHRAPDANGLAAWKANLAKGISQPNIISVFVTTPEYLSYNHII